MRGVRCRTRYRIIVLPFPCLRPLCVLVNINLGSLEERWEERRPGIILLTVSWPTGAFWRIVMTSLVMRSTPTTPLTLLCIVWWRWSWLEWWMAASRRPRRCSSIMMKIPWLHPWKLLIVNFYKELVSCRQRNYNPSSRIRRHQVGSISLSRLHYHSALPPLSPPFIKCKMI